MKKCKQCHFSIGDMCMYFHSWKKDVNFKNCSEQLILDVIQLKKYKEDYEKNKEKILNDTVEALKKEFNCDVHIIETGTVK